MTEWNFVEGVGWITLTIVATRTIYNVAHFVYTTFLGHLFGHSIDLRTCGPWAVVTGATDGIGKSIAKNLAAAGLNVVLVSRNPEKLKKVADEFKNYRIQVKTIAVDFTESQPTYKTLKAELSRFQIGILINNVGMMIGKGECFGIHDDEKSTFDIVNCNVLSVAKMCEIVLPRMIERRSGIIINIGSLSSAVPTPYLTIYGATKAFVEKFSQDLASSVKPFGILIQTVLPGGVSTNMTADMRSSFSLPHPDIYVTAMFKTLGLEDRTAGYWVHKIQLYVGELIKFFLSRSFLEYLVMKRYELEKKRITDSLKST